MITAARPNSHVQLLVPIQYANAASPAVEVVGGSSYYYDALYDQDPLTYSDLEGSHVSALGFFEDITCPKWLWVGINENPNFPIGSYYELTPVDTIDSLTEERTSLTSSAWSKFESVKFKRAAGEGSQSSALLELSCLDPVNNLTITSNSVVSSRNYHIIYSNDFRLPVWNIGHSEKYSFADATIDRTKQGLSFVDFRNFRNNALICQHTFEWSILSDAEMKVVDDFMTAFNGMFGQPFVMCVIHGDQPNGFIDMTSRILVLDPQTININKDRNGDNGFSFTATEIFRNFFSEGT